MNTNFYKLGLIGKTLSYSISPIIQEAALKSVNLNGVYKKFEITSDDILKTLEFLKKSNYKGFNITIPYKVDIINYLDVLDENARNIGAVNTVKINKDGKLTGFNTDVYGFYTSLIQKKQIINNAAIFGAGGAAKAVIFGLIPTGCKTVTIYSRDKMKTEKFINDIKNKTDMTFIQKDISNDIIFDNIDVLINATPLGTKGLNEKFSPVSIKSMMSLNKDALVYDLVYNPQETLLLQYAKELKLNYTNGLEMLLLQGAKAFEIWTAKKPDIELMRQSAINFLNN